MECWTRARHSIAGATADKVVVFVLSRMSFLNRFLRSSRESNELFLGAARPEIIKVSIAGKSFFCMKTSLKIMLCWKCLFSTRAWNKLTIFQSPAGRQGSVLWIIFACNFSSIVQFKKRLGFRSFLRGLNCQNRTWSWGFYRDLS